MKDKWNPYTSKWKAALEKGLDINLNGEENILYLGASSGTTVNHLTKLTKGIIFAVEKSFQMAIPLIKLCEKKENICPVFCDAIDIKYIKEKLDSIKINILFCDIPSFNQADILIKNSEIVYSDCKILFSLKTQSIRQDSPERICKDVEKQLKKNFKIISKLNLEPYHKKHFFFVLKKSI